MMKMKRPIYYFIALGSHLLSILLLSGCVSFQLSPEEMISQPSVIQDKNQTISHLNPRVYLILHKWDFPGAIPDNTQALGEAIILSNQDILFTSIHEADYFLVVSNIFVDQKSEGAIAVHEGIITWVLIEKSTGRLFGTKTEVTGEANVDFWSKSGPEKTRLAMIDYYQRSIVEGLKDVRLWFSNTLDSNHLPDDHFSFNLSEDFEIYPESLLEIGYIVASCSRVRETWHHHNVNELFIECVKEQLNILLDHDNK